MVDIVLPLNRPMKVSRTPNPIGVALKEAERSVPPKDSQWQI